MARASNIEREILDTGALQVQEFTAHNGELGNCKIVLDNLLNTHQHPELLRKVVKRLSRKLGLHQPEIILPIPEGANRFGRLVAVELGARAILLEWQDKEAGELRFKHQPERIVVCRSKRVALVDDVYRTGSSFEEAINSVELESKELVGGVVWDRSDGWQHSAFPIESVVRKYVPMRVDQ